jgi:hypothetical protein
MGVVTGGGGGGGGLPTGLTFTRTTGNNPFLTLEAGDDGTAALAASGLGAQLELSAANGDASHVGGEVTITSGNSLGQSGGDIQVTAGSDSGGGIGGNVTVQSGRGTIGRGGDVDIRAHPQGAAGGRGGRVTISGGAGATAGGRVELDAGAPNGEVVMYSGDSNQYVQLDNGGLQIGATKLGFYQAATVVQPTGVAVTAAGIHAALVSLGLITA